MAFVELCWCIWSLDYFQIGMLFHGSSISLLLILKEDHFMRWQLHLLIFVVVNFEGPAQASDIRIEMR